MFLVGLAVILALIFGVASTALGANGDNFILGKKNVARAVSTLVKQGAGPALKLQVGAGQPPLAVNSTARVANLNAATAGRADSAASADSAANADKLGGLSSNELVRVGQGVNLNSFPAVTFTDRTTATVQVPAAGFVLVNGTVMGQTNSTSCNPCHAFARVRHNNSQQQSAGMINTIGNGTTNTSRTTVPMTWVFPVQAGSNSFTLRTGTFPEPSPIDFFNPTLTALYVPFGSSGTGTLGSSSMAASAMGEVTEQASDGVRTTK